MTDLAKLGKMPPNGAMPASLNESELTLLALLQIKSDTEDDDPSGWVQFGRLLPGLRRRMTLCWSNVTGLIIPNVFELDRLSSRNAFVARTRDGNGPRRQRNLADYYRKAYRYHVKYPRLITVIDGAGNRYPMETISVRYQLRDIFLEEVAAPSRESINAHWLAHHRFHVRNYAAIRQVDEDMVPEDPSELEGPAMAHVPMHQVPMQPILPPVHGHAQQENQVMQAQNQLDEDNFVWDD